MVFATCVQKKYMQNYKKELYCSCTQITFLHCIGDGIEDGIPLKIVFTPYHCNKTE